jgi:hypothetical protein
VRDARDAKSRNNYSAEARPHALGQREFFAVVGRADLPLMQVFQASEPDRLLAAAGRPFAAVRPVGAPSEEQTSIRLKLSVTARQAAANHRARVLPESGPP